MKHLLAISLLLSSMCGLHAQDGYDHLLELSSGTVSRSCTEEPLPYSMITGIPLQAVDSGQGNGYFISLGWGGYVHGGSSSILAFFGVRFRYENVRYQWQQTAELISASSFFHETWEYNPTRSVQSVGLSTPVMLVMRPATWGEVRLGWELSGMYPISKREEGTIVETRYDYSYSGHELLSTSIYTMDIKAVPDVQSKMQYMATAQIGYRQRIGRLQIGPDLIFRLIDTSADIQTKAPWMVSCWLGWSIR